MPKIVCCLCSRRTDTPRQRIRVGADSNWPMLMIHSEKNGLDMALFSKDDYVCMKCHSIISHHRMKDRGSNKIIKDFRPIAREPGINKSVLRNFGKPLLHAPNASNPEVSLEDVESSSLLDGNEMSVDLDVSIEPAPGEIAVTDEPVSKDSETVDDLRQQLQSTIETDATDNATDTIPTDDYYGIDMSDTVVDLSNIIENSQSNGAMSLDLPAEAVSNVLHLKGVKTTQARCFICHSKSGRKAIPWPAIQQAWFERRCYIPKANRTCEQHLSVCNKFTDDALESIANAKLEINVKVTDFELWLNGISDLPNSTPYSFEEDGIEAAKYRMFFGIQKADFDDLLTYLKGMRNTETRSLRTALAMFLLLLRNNMKQEVIAHNFSTTQQVVSRTIDAVSSTLHEQFVPQYLGYHHITRDEALRKHSIKLTSKVLGRDESHLCVIADGTYNYIEKPSDFELQRKTFSSHKKRNLLKPLYVVFPSGYILEAAGPYFCDAKNNDAANIRHHYKNSDLLLFLEDDDYFLFDRGYRDVVEETENHGQSVFMPSLLTGKRTHFTCGEANSSRKVTMFRWVVESVNGRIKNVFPFFKHMIEGSYVPKIMRFNRIACAIMNKYFPPLCVNNDFHEVISKVISEVPGKHDSQTNTLKAEIESLGLKRMTSRWEKASDSTAQDFPKLSMEDLKRITLGTYQIKIAGKYIESHMKEDSTFGIFIHRENESIIRAKIQSRFSKSKTHDAWVKFEKGSAGYEAITGLYCTCKVGERSLGCCSHLTSIIRYLGHDRHQPLETKSHFRSAWDAIDCDDSCNESSSDADDDM